jgi:serine phosphatase RsbU (regulator of sigma subunit)
VVTAPSEGLEAFRSLVRLSHLSRADDLATLVSEAASQLGVCRAVVYMVDYDQAELLGLPDGPGARPVALGVDGTLPGRAFRDVALRLGTDEESTTAWVPMVDGTDRLGILQLVFPHSRDVDEDLLELSQDFANLVAELVVTRSLYGDAIELARRRAPLSLPAELQWRLLPPLTFVAPRVAVAGILAPSTEVAGDSFDYAVNGDVAHVAIIDAMGHGLEACLLAAVAIAALRNGRRSGLGLAPLVSSIDAELGRAFGPDRFVTGIFGELNTVTGVWTWTTCGHPPALLVRNGRVVKRLDQAIGVPLGLGLLGDPELVHERLEPGDRILLFTDGVVEARDAARDFFGTDRLVDLVVKEAASGRSVAETLRRLNQEIIRFQDGALRDDATTVLVEWLTDEQARSTPELRVPRLSQPRDPGPH